MSTLIKCRRYLILIRIFLVIRCVFSLYAKVDHLAEEKGPGSFLKYGIIFDFTSGAVNHLIYDGVI